MATTLGNITIINVAVGSSAATALALGDVAVWSKEAPAPVTGPWLCFTAEQANSTVRLDKSSSSLSSVSLEASTDGSTWKDYSWSGNTGYLYTLANVGDKVYMRAKNENLSFSVGGSGYYNFKMTGTIAASGNIQTLLKADGSRTDVPVNAYLRLFYQCSSLVTAPELPATELNSGSYDSMFCWCTSLQTVPEIFATTLAYKCFSYTFQHCYALSSLKVNFTSFIGTDYWVENVNSSGTFYCPTALGTNQTIQRGNDYCPTNWTVVNQTPYVSVDYIIADGQQCLPTGFAALSGDSWELTWAPTMLYADLPSNAGENVGWNIEFYQSGGGRCTNGQVKPWMIGNVEYSPVVYANTVSAGEIFTEHIDTALNGSNVSCYCTMYRHATQQQSVGTKSVPTFYYPASTVMSLASQNKIQHDTTYSCMKIYRWKHWREGQLVEDLIPVNYNGVGAMYDLVSEQFITSNTGTDFLLPSA